MSTDFEIRPLATENLDDFLAFFESVKFTDHPDWSSCYCYSFHFTGPSDEWNREKNRSAVCELVRAGRMTGYLAYYQGVPVGWCNVNNRLNYKRLIEYYDLIDPEHQKTCSIVCFLIHPDFRRQGITQQLLQRIIQDYTQFGYEYIEAYPGKGERSNEAHYMGPPNLYKRNGFKEVKAYEDHIIVRRALTNR